MCLFVRLLAFFICFIFVPRPMDTIEKYEEKWGMDLLMWVCRYDYAHILCRNVFEYLYTALVQRQHATTLIVL